MKAPTLLTSAEIFEQRPVIANYFNQPQLGYLFFCGMIRGKKLSRKTLFCSEDVLDCIDQKKKIKAV